MELQWRKCYIYIAFAFKYCIRYVEGNKSSDKMKQEGPGEKISEINFGHCVSPLSERKVFFVGFNCAVILFRWNWDFVT